MVLCFSAVSMTGCGNTPSGAAIPDATPPPRVSVDEIIKGYKDTDNYRSSLVKSRARITEADGSAQEIEMTVYRNRAEDGAQKLLVQFPGQQRDRSGLILISPEGDIEGIRYAQSTGSYVSSKNVSGEDSLFGMSLQELADGQPDKYDFKLAGEDKSGEVPVYKLDGKLKAGAESKFQRLVVYLAKDSFALAGADFYYSQDELARRVTVEKLERVGGYWTRQVWSVDNIARGKKVRFETLSVRYDREIPDSTFTRENLKQISIR
jgi:hypothetical protein